MQMLSHCEETQFRLQRNGFLNYNRPDYIPCVLKLSVVCCKICSFFLYLKFQLPLTVQVESQHFDHSCCVRAALLDTHILMEHTAAAHRLNHSVTTVI